MYIGIFVIAIYLNRLEEKKKPKLRVNEHQRKMMSIKHAPFKTLATLRCVFVCLFTFMQWKIVKVVRVDILKERIEEKNMRQRKEWAS